MEIGANLSTTGICKFVVWAPLVNNISLKIVYPEERLLPMRVDEKGYWSTLADNIEHGSRYFYVINNEIERPDPASFCQEDGVHASSKIIDHSLFEWGDLTWRGIEVKDLIIYELHMGTFTPEGTFFSAANKLKYLKDLGITSIEIMPVFQFPGSRNWGYDGVYHFSPQSTYGGVIGLKHLINEAHKIGIAVILDVVYNHCGPEGNYLSNFGPYFTTNYKTPWGQAINFDSEYSDEVKNYFLENIKYWLNYFHIDGLRLDAIDKIFDLSAKHFLSLVAETVHKISDEDQRNHFVIAECDLNDTKVVTFKENNGYGIDSQWSDDFHHSVHALLTHERNGYYMDFGTVDHLVKAINLSFVYDGCYSSYRKRTHGNKVGELPYDKFVLYIQNHDQIGNRALSERLTSLVSFEALKLAAGTLFFIPCIPLIFMGEEYGENNPFQYFIDFDDPVLVNNIKEGRKKEFSVFKWDKIMPDPNDEKTFLDSKLDWDKINNPPYFYIYKYYKDLIGLRKAHPLLKLVERKYLKAEIINDDIVKITRKDDKDNEIYSIANWSDKEKIIINNNSNDYSLILDSYSKKYGGGKKIEEKTNEIVMLPYHFKIFEKGN